MHADEAVQGLKFIELLERGSYRYDANEFHGPTLNYLSLPAARLRGERDRYALTETTLRVIPVVFGVGLILLLPLLADGLGRNSTLGAGLFTAVSPAFVFYSRYYIHEMLLVFFTFMFLCACWQYTRNKKRGWAALAGVALGLMHATKETFVLPLLAMVAAWLITMFWERRCAKQPATGTDRPATFRWRDVIAGLCMAVAVSVTFYTSFFAHWRGAIDSVLTYLPWLQRAGGASPHIHPWSFYLERLVYYSRPGGHVSTEGVLLVLAGIGAIAAFRPRLLPQSDSKLVRFLMVYSLALTIAYSAISYKTPWCLLGFHHGFILLAGVGTAALFRACSTALPKVVCGIILACGLAHLGAQTWRAAYTQPADRLNPYVYAHTAPDLLRLVDKVSAIARAHPDPDKFAIQVMAPGGDYWPLPWYFRIYRHTGWWNNIPEDPYASVMVVGARFHADLDEKSEKRWLMVGFFEDRPGVFFELYVELELWKRYVATLPRDDD